jgi:glycosyltransferase involved in cell wall biosynthesis
MANNTVSVVIPVFNSQSTLDELTIRLGHILPVVSDEYELIFVNDGSCDESWKEITQLVKQYAWVRGINLMRNYGQHNALLCGLRSARYAVTITMDDDLQHPPEQIPILMAKLKEGFAVVYGSPKTLPHSLWRNFFSRLTKRLLAMVMGIPAIRDIGAFRAFNTELRQAFVGYQNPNVILDVLLSWGTTNFTTVPVDEDPRQVGSSNYTFYKLFIQAMFILTGFSTAPLRLASMLGFTFTLFGIFIFVYVVIAYLSAGSIPGFPFLASIIALFSGTQLFTLGIFGEYLARMFDRSMDRPTYVVHNTVGGKEQP